MVELGPADLSIVIPTRDRWPILTETLAALRRQTVTGFRVVVVVDGTDQDPPELADAEVVVKPHGGPGAARNAGVRAADTALVLFLGDDMIPAPDLVERHLHRHRQEPAPEVAVLGFVQWHPSVGDSPLHRWLTWSGTQFDYEHINGADAGFGRFYSCNVSLKRAFFLAAGGFDEDFTYYYEDLDCAWRLHERGLVLRPERRALTYHRHDYDLEAIRGRFRGIATGEGVMAGKHQWFQPFFRARSVGALTAPDVSPAWALAADRSYRTSGRIPRTIRTRANRWWYQQVGDAFLDTWEGERGLAELKRYLADGYDERRLREHVQEIEREESAARDEATFYRTSEAYLYDLTVFAMTATKTPYLRLLRRWVPRGSRLLDYGCGIGSDGLRLLDLGHQVSFADFANPSTRFLQWRLESRGHHAPVYDVDDHVPGGFDAVYCFDVIEHVDDPFAFLAELEQRGDVVVVNFLEPAEHDVHVHKPLPIQRLLDHVRAQQLLAYEQHHGRSHVVVYRPHRRGSTGRFVTAQAQRVGRRVERRLAATLGV
jgi:glycosyltransferase involved in cell wall biosynthesis